MTEVYLALGSNVGNSERFIENAIELIEAKISSIKRAPLYRSKAAGYANQPDFFNTAIKGQTKLSPDELLRFVKDVEQKVGRVERFRWGPREIDIDIIFYGDQIVDQPDLHIPHIRFAERDFVLKPICDLNAELIDPRSKLTTNKLYIELLEEDKSIY